MAPEILIKSYLRRLKLRQKYEGEILRTASSTSKKRSRISSEAALITIVIS